MKTNDDYHMIFRVSRIKIILINLLPPDVSPRYETPAIDKRFVHCIPHVYEIGPSQMVADDQEGVPYNLSCKSLVDHLAFLFHLATCSTLNNLKCQECLASEVPRSILATFPVSCKNQDSVFPNSSSCQILLEVHSSGCSL